MRKIEIKVLFQRLCGLEYELLKYINRTQGEASAPVNFFEAAIALSVDKDDIRKACTRLVQKKVLLVEGENFKIDEAIYKDEK